MTILLVGGQSAVAQALAPCLADLGQLITAGRYGCDVSLDLAWPFQKVKVPQEIDVVVNTAACFETTGGDGVCSSVEVNVLGASKLCAASIESGVRHFVNVSSINAVLSEDSPYFDAYALTKKQGDEAIKLLCRSANVACAILRPSQIYGQPPFRKRQRFLYGAIDQALSGKNIVIYGARAPLRNYLHAEDFSKLVRSTIEKRLEGIYQCTHPCDSSFEDIALAAIAAAGTTSRLVFDVNQRDIPDNVFPFEDSLYRELEFYPEISISAGVARATNNAAQAS
jgi:nucleoside-diphosphate-sugar epimerase